MKYFGLELKFWLIFVCFALIFYKWYSTETVHQQFYEEVRAFMEVGARNPAEFGYELCAKINEINKEIGNAEKIMDCEGIYYNGEKPTAKGKNDTSMLDLSAYRMIDYYRSERSTANRGE